MDPGGAYDKLQSTEPQALAHALAGSRSGNSAGAQLLGLNLDPDHMLTNTMIYVYDKGNHFAAHDVPDLLVNDICSFFRQPH
ncbi:hypothetical protein [Micromonospora violae]|uniref:hypothetical protein n=1 Tax=Micromonospora violae TaxID=1278207 RepID=UPI0033D0093E